MKKKHTWHKKILSILLTAVIMLTLIPALPVAACSDCDGNESTALIAAINGFNSGTGGKLQAEWDEETATVTVTNKDNIPLEGVTEWLTLDIPDGITVDWQADISGNLNQSSLIFIIKSTMGTGTFQVSPGGAISAAGYNARAIFAISNTIININGGTVSATGDIASAIETGEKSRVNVDSGTVSAIGINNSNAYAISVSNDSTVSVNGGMVSTIGNVAYTISAENSTLEIGGGTVSAIGDAYACAIFAYDSTVNVVGSTVSAIGYNNTCAIFAMGNSIVDVSGGLVFAQANELWGYNGVVNIEPIVTGTGAVIGWDSKAGNTIYTAGTSKDLHSDPADGVVWAVNSDGKSGISYPVGTGSEFFDLNDYVTVTLDNNVPSGISVNGCAPLNAVSEIRDAIAAALQSGDANVTGSFNGADRWLNLDIPAGKKVIWQAEYTNTNAIFLTGSGTFEINDGGIINVADSYYARAILASENNIISINGGTISATGKYACAIFASENTTININGGTINATGSSASAIFAMDCKINISSGTISATGNNACAISASENNTININGGTISATSSSAIFAYENNIININGGIIKATGEMASAISAYGNTININGGAIISIGGTNAIYTVSNRTIINISGGLVFSQAKAVWGYYGVINIEPNFTGTGTVIGWDNSAGNAEYNAGTTTDLYSEPDDGVVWAVNSDGKSGISYPSNTGSEFFDLSDYVTVVFDSQEVAEDKANLTWSVIQGTNTAENNITAHLATLPLTGANGTTISWVSNTPDVIANDGIVTRPAYNSGDATVTLTATISKSSASDTVIFTLTVKALPPNTLTGTATISNTTPRIGDILNASLEDGNNTGNLTYTWKTGTDILGIGESYTVKTADLGKQITLEITSTIETDTVTSLATEIVLKKEAPEAPTAPTFVSRTSSSITLTANPTYEFSRNGATWQTSNIFGGLAPDTTYTFYQRIAETADTEASEASAGLSVTTNASNGGNQPPPPPPPPPESKPEPETRIIDLGNGLKAILRADGVLEAKVTAADIAKLRDSDRVITINIPSEFENILFLLPVNAFNRNYTLKVNTGFGSKIIPAKTLQSMDSATDNDLLKVSVSKGSFTVNVLDSKERPINYNDPENPFFISLPYTLKKNQNENSIVAVKKDGANNIIMPFAVYDSDSRSITFSVSSTGTYDVIHNQKTFSDITNHWARDSIQFIAAREITDGTGNNMFSPNATLTRAMFVTFIAKLEGVTLNNINTTRFSDVPAGEWYANAVNWAADNRITNGVGNGKFDPYGTITHEQMVVMLNRYLEYKKYTLNNATGTGTIKYTDINKLNTWAINAVTEFSQKGILNSESNTKGFVFNPQKAATRAEMATILERFIKALAD